MSFKIKIDKVFLQMKTPRGEFSTEALALFPEGKDHYKNTLAVFTHGYTAEKTPLLPWAIRLADFAIPTIIFDLPGHYLAHFHELDSFENFQNHAHQLFSFALNSLTKKSLFNINDRTKIIFGGHSLGGLLALKALMNEDIKIYDKLGIGVGVGIQKEDTPHLFETKFYEKTMMIRSQLVSPFLNPQNVFEWLYEEKKNIQTFHQKISLITGLDDFIVGPDGVLRFKELLEKHSNIVHLEQPERLQHNQPELAAGLVYRHVKEFLASS